MAATKLIAMHQNKGLTQGETFDARCKYVENPDKTEDGKLISAYACDPKAVASEFALMKRNYDAYIGKIIPGDIIAYQIRQSFKPGEITPEEANRIGYETAMRFTKGNHAFIVCTHTDKPHIHNHILYCAADLKQQRKFRNFLFSGIALQRLSDIICLENGLSVIQPRKPSERDRHVFPKVENKRDVIKLAIDVALSKQPKDYEEFLWLMQRQDFEIKRGKHTAVRGKGGERFIRFRSLGDGYRESDIREKIAALQKNGRAKVQPKKEDSFDLLLNIQDIIAKGKGPGYERRAKKYNIKNLAKALIFFQENDIRSYEELAKRAADSSKNFSELSARIKAAEKRLDEISALREQLINYAKTKDIYVQYKKSGYSKKFFEAHREDIMKHKAAKDTFEKMNGQKIPSVRELNDEFQQVLTQKRKDYSEYHEAKEKMQLYKTAKYDIDRILNQDIEKEKARLQSRERSQTR